MQISIRVGVVQVISVSSSRKSMNSKPARSRRQALTAWRAREIMGEIGQCTVLERTHDLGHDGLIFGALAAFVALQGCQQVILALRRNARHGIPAAEGLAVAEAAAMLG